MGQATQKLNQKLHLHGHIPKQHNQAEPIIRQVEQRPGASRFLQRHAGNHKMQEMGLYSGLTLQRSVADNMPSLIVNRPGDEYEQEADEVAEQVMSLPDATPEIRSLRRITQTDLQRIEASSSPQILPSIRQVNRPLRPSNPVDQMSKLLGTAQGNASRQAKLCYRAFARNVLLAGGYGDILNLKDDERFQGYTHHALLFADAVAKNRAEQLGLEEIIGNPFHAEPGTILVLFGSADLGIDMNWGDISVIGGWSGRNRVCYNDGTMVLPGVAASWDPGGRYAGLVAGMYRPLLRPALEEKARTSSIELQRLQRRVDAEPASDIAPLIVHDVLHAPSQPLEVGTRAFMESRFGQDFSGVRVHTDTQAAESARAVNALAYTVGRDVVFGAGKYQPEMNEGKRLLAHELAHVVQQQSGADMSALELMQRQVESPRTIEIDSSGLSIDLKDKPHRTYAFFTNNLEPEDTDLGMLQRVLIVETGLLGRHGLQEVAALILNRLQDNQYEFKEIKTLKKIIQKGKFQGYPYKKGSEQRDLIDECLSIINNPKDSRRSVYTDYLSEVTEVALQIIEGSIHDMFYPKKALYMWAVGVEGDVFEDKPVAEFLGIVGGNKFYGHR